MINGSNLNSQISITERKIHKKCVEIFALFSKALTLQTFYIILNKKWDFSLAKLRKDENNDNNKSQTIEMKNIWSDDNVSL